VLGATNLKYGHIFKIWPQNGQSGNPWSGADVQAPWHGVLETVWLLCDEAQQVGYLRGLEGCPLV